LPLVILFATLGSLGGSLTLYTAGAVLGRRRFFRVVEVVPLVEVSDIEKADEWFQRHGRSAVFFGRLIPLIRSGISVPAGITRMPMLEFCLYTTLGSTLWNTIFILL